MSEPELGEHMSVRISDQGRWFIEELARETRVHRSTVAREMFELASEHRAELVARLLRQSVTKERKRG
jgi:hypothetical protein